jgi:hypothetical protein
MTKKRNRGHVITVYVAEPDYEQLRRRALLGGTNVSHLLASAARELARSTVTPAVITIPGADAPITLTGRSRV